MQQRIGYESRTDPTKPRANQRPTIILGGVFIVVNAGLLLLASDGGRGGIVVAEFIGPATNVLVALIALLLSSVVRRAYGSRNAYLFCACGLPIVAVVGDSFVIVGMGWTGC